MKTDDGVITFTKVDDTDIKLNGDVDGSKKSDVFTTRELKTAEDTSKDDEKKDSGDQSSETKKAITSLNGEYYSDNTDSYVTFYSDGTFSMTEIEGMGACLIEGTYKIENNKVTVNVDYADIIVENSIIEFDIEDESTLILKTDLQPSKSGDKFVMGPSGAPELEHSLYVCDKSNLGLQEPYLPYIEFDSAGFFTFHANYGEGMCDINGYWSKENGEYIANIVDGPSDLSIDEMRFKIVDDTHIKLNTNVYMTMEGDTFKLTSLDYLNK